MCVWGGLQFSLTVNQEKGDALHPGLPHAADREAKSLPPALKQHVSS